MEFEEEQRQKHPYVSLWDPLNGERYRLEEVGEAPDFLVPVKAFKAEDIVGHHLVKLTWTKKDGHICRMGQQKNPSCPMHLCPPSSATTTCTWGEPGEHRERQRGSVCEVQSRA